MAPRSSARYYDIETGTEVLHLPSVTTILQVVAKPALVGWAARTERDLVVRAAQELYSDLPAGPKLSPAGFSASLGRYIPKTKAHVKAIEEAQAVGKKAHARIEWDLRREAGLSIPSQAPEVDGPAGSAYSAWLEWRSQVHFRPLHVEQTVWSRKYAYAGTLDCLAEIRDPDGNIVRCVADWKTSSGIYPESTMQVAAYSHAWTEMGRGSAPWGLVVRLAKVQAEKMFEIKLVTPEEMAKAHISFRAAAYLWRWLEAA